MINFQRSHVIETTDQDEASSESNLEHQVMNNMKSESPMDRLFAMSKVNSMLKIGYLNNDFTDPIDTKLVMGLYNRKTDMNGFMKRYKALITNQEEISN
jgi:hypothetical protein